MHILFSFYFGVHFIDVVLEIYLRNVSKHGDRLEVFGHSSENLRLLFLVDVFFIVGSNLVDVAHEI